ncbi:hypothetical protein H8K33_05570 [Undibacterium amnicola]|uniref:Uncharacterized protein n=1 Tax=Undibacterium amnicola TaxID=1834038 RepID=A0ABR6XN86_9BURK|nr:HAD domain-containing protein [Undibacterium amnicola]MBC3830967.1 hypothetical protein [Undibacterium amnicola]
MTKVLYLDYDGVLHDDAVYWHPKHGIYLKTPGRTLFEWMYILENLLSPHPDVGIVLSTSWVRAKSFEYAKSQLSAPLREKVIGATFHRREMHKIEFDLTARGVQIWNDVQRRNPTSWFAIDNDNERWPAHCRDKLVLTQDRLGLSEVKVQNEVMAMLNLL